MSDKKRTSITIDQEVYEFLQQGQINQSGLINELVQRYRESKDRDVAALEQQRERLIEEAEELEERAETKRQHAANLEELIAEAKEHKQTDVDRAREALEHTDKEPDNPAIKRWAEKLGMTPEKLINVLE